MILSDDYYIFNFGDSNDLYIICRDLRFKKYNFVSE